MTRQPPVHQTALRESLESRLGVRIAAALGERAAAVPHEVSERLRAAREQALAQSRSTRRVAEQASGVRRQGGAAVLLGGGSSRWWLRAATWLPLVLLVAGLVAIEQWTAREQVLAAAEIDAVLLTDELPPGAWADPGFREFLKTPRQ